MTEEIFQVRSYRVILEEFRRLTEQIGWREFVLKTGAKDARISSDYSNALGVYWIEAGHRIREQVADDSALVAFLRLSLPVYEGDPLKLYRGENLDRWQERRIGLCWTEDVKVAEMFAAGLNAVNGGGVLLMGTFPSDAVISVPNSHSIYLGEAQFTVDPSMAVAIEEVSKFVPWSSTGK